MSECKCATLKKEEYKVSPFYLSAIINGDFSSLSEEDCGDLLRWLEAIVANRDGHFCHNDETGDFCRCDISGKMAMCETLYFVIGEHEND